MQPDDVVLALAGHLRPLASATAGQRAFRWAARNLGSTESTRPGVPTRVLDVELVEVSELPADLLVLRGASGGEVVIDVTQIEASGTGNGRPISAQ